MNHQLVSGAATEHHGITRTSESGVIYVEVLVAMFILALSVLAMLPLLVTASHENGAARDLTFATAAAQDKVEQLKVIDPSSLADGTEVLSHEAVTYVRTWSVIDDTPAIGMKSVTVTVTSQRNNTLGGVRPAEVTFYRTN